jgi:very-short-patch-repair endonuclease
LSYKKRLHSPVSRAEVELFKSLSAAKLTDGMVTQKTIVLKSTIPDFCWLNRRKIVYLDGIQAHLRDRQKKNDQEIDEMLTAQGWEVLRIPYDPPLTEKNLKETTEIIRKFLGLDDK